METAVQQGFELPAEGLELEGTSSEKLRDQAFTISGLTTKVVGALPPVGVMVELNKRNTSFRSTCPKDTWPGPSNPALPQARVHEQ